MEWCCKGEIVPVLHEKITIQGVKIACRPQTLNCPEDKRLEKLAKIQRFLFLSSGQRRLYFVTGHVLEHTLSTHMELLF